MSDPDTTVRRRDVLAGTGASLALLAGCTGEQEGQDGGATTTAEEGTMDGTEETTTEGDGGGGEATNLTVTALWTEAEAEAFGEVLSYAEQEANVTFEYNPRDTNSLRSGTLMDYQSGVAPADVVVMPFPSRIQTDGRNGHLEALGDLWDPGSFAVEPDPVTVDGTTYAAPFKLDLKPGFWYRQSFFDEHGLSEPESYDEFTSLLDELSGIDGVSAPIASGNGDGWPLSDQVEAFFLRQENGAELQRSLISGDTGFTDDRVISAFEEVKSLLDQGYFSQTRGFAVQYEHFWNNELPLYFMGSWTPAMDPVQDPADLGVFTLPGTGAMVGSVNWMTVPTYSENVDAAKEAVSAMISAEGQARWAEQGGFIASHQEVGSDSYEAEIMGGLSQMAADNTLVPDLDDSLGSPFQDEFWAQLKGFWSDPGGTDVNQLASTLESAQNESLQE